MRQCRNVGGSESQVKGFSSLLGTQKKILLYELSSKLNEFLYPDTYVCATVKNMCDVFDSLCNKISDLYLTVAAAYNVFDEGKAFLFPTRGTPWVYQTQDNSLYARYCLPPSFLCSEAWLSQNVHRLRGRKEHFFPRRNSFQK